MGITLWCETLGKEASMTSVPLVKQLLLSIALSTRTLCASAAQADDLGHRGAVYDSLCAKDLRLDPATVDYAVCVKTLDLAQRGKISNADPDPSPTTATERRICGDVAASSGSQAIDRCIINLRASLWTERDISAR